eukprot:9480405-Alexandrium_andersonii.AAC.1
MPRLVHPGVPAGPVCECLGMAEGPVPLGHSHVVIGRALSSRCPLHMFHTGTCSGYPCAPSAGH